MLPTHIRTQPIHRRIAMRPGYLHAYVRRRVYMWVEGGACLGAGLDVVGFVGGESNHSPITRLHFLLRCIKSRIQQCLIPRQLQIDRFILILRSCVLPAAHWRRIWRRDTCLSIPHTGGVVGGDVGVGFVGVEVVAVGGFDAG